MFHILRMSGNEVFVGFQIEYSLVPGDISIGFELVETDN
jgi:hypothetical protein